MSLFDDVHMALKQWHMVGQDASPLSHLLLFKQMQTPGHNEARGVTNELLLNGLITLEAEDDEKSMVLRLRFLERMPILAVTRRLNLSEASVKRRQSAALESLTRIIETQEERCKRKHQSILLKRLPIPTYDALIGRQEQVQSLIDCLTPDEAPWLISIEGIGGCGKTALANAVLRQVIEENIFQEVGWVSAWQQPGSWEQGGRRVAGSASSIVGITEQLATQLLGDFGNFTSLSQDEIQSALHHKLSQHRHLIVIDNLESVADVEQLLPAIRNLANPTKFLLTSRENFYSEPTFHFRLSELTNLDAHALIRSEASQHNLPTLIQASDNDLDQIYQAVGGNPLALRLVVGQAHVYGLDLILENLRVARGRAVDGLYSAIYHHIWKQLDQSSRHILLAMLLVSKTQKIVPHLAQVTAFDQAQVVDGLDNLVRLNVVDKTNSLQVPHYYIHPLTRTFLQTLVIYPHQETPAVDYRAIWHKQLVNGMQYILDALAQCSSGISTELQYQTLAVLDYALNVREIWRTTRTLFLTIAPKMEQAGQRDTWMPYLQRGLQQGELAEDDDVILEANFHLGLLYEMRGDYEQAKTHLAASAKRCAKLNRLEDQARALNRLAYVARRQRQLKEAAQLIDQALTLVPKDHTEVAYSHMVLGALALDRREWEAAIPLFQQAHDLWERVNDERKTAWSLTNLGAALRGAGSLEAAKIAYNDAIKRLVQTDDPINLAVAQMNLGNIFLDLNQPDQSLTYFEAAEQVFSLAQERLRLAKIYNNLGIAHRRLQNWGKAEVYFEKSIELFEYTSNFPSVINALDGLGLVYFEQEAIDKARATFERALNTLEAITGDPLYGYLFEKVSGHLDDASED